MASACVYIECPITGQVLAVSRKDDPDAWGLPGGKVEDGETEAQAAERELREETGLGIYYENLVEVFRRDGGVTYGVKDGVEWVLALFTPSPVKEAGRVAWVTKEQLVAGPFGDYNRRLLQHIGKI